MIAQLAATLAVLVTGTFELSIVAKATLIFAAGLAAARLARRATASIRHLVLAATFAAVFVLPSAAFLAPPLRVTALAPPAPAAASVALPRVQRVHTPLDRFLPLPDSAARPSASTPPAARQPWRVALLSVWAAGFLLCLAPMVAGLVRLRRHRLTGLPAAAIDQLVAARRRELGMRRRIECLVHEAVPAPLTCGVSRPALIFPADATSWSDADLQRAIVHELEHVRRLDWFVQLAARTTAAMWWFHPLAWMALRRLRLAAEQACDDAVVGASDRAEYADQLLQLARRLAGAPSEAGLAMANRSDLSARVTAVLDVGRRRGRAGAFAIGAAAIGAGVLVATAAPVQAVVAPFESAAAGAPAQSPRTERPRSRPATGLDRALYRAAARGDVARIAELIAQGADVDCALEGDGSPLIAAARAGQLAAVRTLLERGASPNLAVRGDGNPLIMAAREGHDQVVALLLDRGASIDLLVPGDENALMQASAEGELAVVKLLVSRGADVNARAWTERYDGKGEWRTALLMAERGRHADVVALLRASGAR